jgi:GAF domain-containing protein
VAGWINDVLKWLHDAVIQLSPAGQVLIYLVLLLAFLAIGALLQSYFWLIPLLPGRGDNVKTLKHERDRLKADLSRRADLVNGLSLIARDLAYMCSRRSDPRITWHHLWDTVVTITCEVMQRRKDYACRACVFVRIGEELVPAVASGYSAEGKTKLRLPVEGSVAGQAWMAGEALYCEDILSDKRFCKNPKTTRQYRSVACTPVISQGHVVAILNVDAMPAKAFTSEARDNLATLARTAALVYSEGREQDLELLPIESVDQVAATGEGGSAPDVYNA